MTRTARLGLMLAAAALFAPPGLPAHDRSGFSISRGFRQNTSGVSG